MATRREFLASSAHLAFGIGALDTALGRFAFHHSSLSAATRAAATIEDISLGNDAITAVWSIAGGVFRPVRLTDGVNRSDLPVSPQAFTLTLTDKTTIGASDMRITSPPRLETLTANPRAWHKAEQLAGRSVTLTLQDSDRRIEAIWRGILRDGSHYIRQELTLRALDAEVPLREITLLDFNAPMAVVTGTVRGTPIVVGNAFFAIEDPLADNDVDGVARAGQMRRDFLAYVERERAHPINFAQARNERSILRHSRS